MDFKNLNKSKDKPAKLKNIETAIGNSVKKVQKQSKELRKSRS